MTPERLAEIKGEAAKYSYVPREMIRELTAEVERLQTREADLLAANNRELLRRRDAEALPERIFAAVDALRIRSGD